jgi:hypothetical protein
LFSEMELLNFVSIFEKDVHGDITTSWIYPQFPPNYEEVLLNRTQLRNEKQEEFIYSRVFIEDIILNYYYFYFFFLYLSNNR